LSVPAALIGPVTSIGLWKSNHQFDTENSKIVENPVIDLAKSNRPMDLQFRPDIEGLRAIAVSLVVLHHSGFPFLRGGFIGVDVFFVLSGYLITSLLTKELAVSGRIQLLGFYARRVRRLLPSATAVVVIVCLIQAIVASPVAQFGVLKSAVATILYSSNLYFAHIQSYYFADADAPSPLLHTWSLAVEEQFYLVWPIFLLLLTRIVKDTKSRMLVIAAMALLSFFGSTWLTAGNPVMAFFESPVRAWEFAIGALGTFFSVRWLAAHESLCKHLGTAGLITLVASGAFLKSEGFPGYVAGIPVLATMAILQAWVAGTSSVVVRLLYLRPLQYLGGISYSLYLWHWPVFVIARQAYPTNSAAVRAGCVVLSVLLAAITQVTVENPIRFNPFLMARPLLSLAILGMSLTTCMSGFAIWWKILSHSEQFQRFNKIRNDAPSLYQMGCPTDSTEAGPRVCSSGEMLDPQSTVVLFGDSHAAQWFPALKLIAESRHWKLVTVIKSGCSPMNIASASIDTARGIEACGQWRNLAIAAIQKMRPDVLIISSSSLYPQHGSPTLIDGPQWERGSRDTFVAVAKHAVAVRLIRDTPHADYDVTSCLAQLAWNGRANCPPLIPASALSSDIYQAEVRAAANIAIVRMIDMSDAICGRERCETQEGDLVVYRDGDHLTSSYVKSLANVLQRELRRSLE
jgi:peptidoglycan/LPS O-acetylase OafA/YrhL